METVCRDLKNPAHSIDHLSWYQHILSATDKHDSKLWNATCAALESHADKTNTRDLLERAQHDSSKRYRRPRKTVLEVLQYGLSKARSVRISMADAGKNDVSTAASVVDHVIGSQYTGKPGEVFRLWSPAKRRALERVKQPTPLQAQSA